VVAKTVPTQGRENRGEKGGIRKKRRDISAYKAGEKPGRYREIFLEGLLKKKRYSKFGRRRRRPRRAREKEEKADAKPLNLDLQFGPGGKGKN